MSAIDGVLELQKAIVAAVLADATVAGLIADRFYDDPPQDPTYPLGEIDEIHVEPYDGTSLAGVEAMVTLRAWSEAPGHVEARRVAAAFYDVLHDRNLALDSQLFVNGRLENHHDLDGDDGITTGVFQRYRFVTHS